MYVFRKRNKDNTRAQRLSDRADNITHNILLLE